MAQDGTGWHGMERDGMAWNGMAWHGTGCHGMGHEGMTWDRMAWLGQMAWHGTGWHGMGQDGIASKLRKRVQLQGSLSSHASIARIALTIPSSSRLRLFHGGLADGWSLDRQSAP